MIDKLPPLETLLVVENLLVAIAVLLAVGLVIGVASMLRARASREAREAHDASIAEVSRAQGETLATLARVQAETAVRMQAMGDMLAARQAELGRAVNDRLDSVSHRLGETVEKSKLHTAENLQKLNERLAVIDRAQKNITDLASQMTSLSSVLSNKQQRGAFGQGRMELIVQDGLPKGCYEFQHRLSNNLRPDCAIFLPDGRPLIVDAKFPLEAATAFRDAKSDEERKLAAARLRQDIDKHVKDIAGKYLIPGETQDLALMFVPSESVYAELHDGFDDVVQKAFRAKVVIVSPSLLMLAITVVQQIQRDARMREAADKIHAEVGYLMDDLKRLHERVAKLQQHFGQANEDVRQILISAEKVEKRGTRIREVEFEDEELPSNVIPAPLTRRLQAGE